MAKTQIISENLLETYSQLSLNELEKAASELAQIIRERKARNTKKQELRLLQELNSCVLPEGHLQRFLELKAKRASQELPAKELKLFFELIEEDHEIQIKRVKILKKIADLRNISISKLMGELELKNSVSA